MVNVNQVANFLASTAGKERVRETIQLLPLGSDPMEALTVIEENMRRLRDYVDRRGRSASGRQAIADALGGQLFEGVAVKASVSGAGSADTALAHALGRTPGCVAWWEVAGAPSAPNALLYGHSGGSWGTSGGNQQPWTAQFAYLRSSADAVFNLVLV